MTTRRVSGVSTLLLLTVLWATPTIAQEPAGQARGTDPQQAVPVTGSLDTLEDLILFALDNSPDLAAARLRVLAAREVPDRAASLPDPVLTTIIRNVDFPEVTLGEEMMSAAGVRFSQTLPLGGQRPARRQLAEAGIGVAAARVAVAERRLVRELTVAWYEIGYVDRALEVVVETRTLLRDLERTAEARYSVGNGIQQDVFKAQVELSVLTEREIQLRQQRDTLATRLNRLIGRSADAPLPRPGDLATPEVDLDPQAIQAEAAIGSPHLLVPVESIEQGRAAVDVARSERNPDIMLAGAWMSRGGLPSLWEINVGLTLPIRRGQRQDRALAEAIHELEARHQQRRDAGVDVQAQVRTALLEVDRASRLERLFDEAILPQAGLSLESALSGYSVGKVDFLTVLDNVVTLLTYQVELARERANALQGLARIEEHVGRSLGAVPATAWESIR